MQSTTKKQKAVEQNKRSTPQGNSKPRDFHPLNSKSSGGPTSIFLSQKEKRENVTIRPPLAHLKGCSLLFFFFLSYI